MGKKKLSPEELYEVMAALGRMLYGAGLAAMIDKAPFPTNTHKFPHTGYPCVTCWRPPGNHPPCEHDE